MSVEAAGLAGSYIFGWLIGYSGLLGPVAGIMVGGLVLIRGQRAGCELALPPRRRVLLQERNQFVIVCGAGDWAWALR